ncbi:MAG: ATP-binding protein [Firmicutes bacterium]|nr:ATP-binding protein [Bacillota bacterium]
MFQKAQRKKAKLRLGIAGPAGSGKTYSALLIAFGLGGKVAVIDTERSSAELYSHLGDYDVCVLEPPFTPKKYIDAIREAENAGYDVIIIDSLSHAWAGPGGILEMHDAAAAKEKNSWTAWRLVTPQHNELVDAMLQSKCHVIATMRSKMETAQVDDGGRKKVVKLGMAPIQRDGMEYEFTVFFDIDATHTAVATKDRTSMFDGITFRPNQETGRKLLAWLNGGAEPAKKTGEAKTAEKAKPEEGAKQLPQAGENKTPEVVPYDNQVVITEGVVDRHTYVETRGTDLNNDEVILFISKRLHIVDIKPGAIVKIAGKRKENKINVQSLEVVTLFEPPGAPAETPAEAPVLWVAKEFSAARDTLPDGTIKEIIWTYAEDKFGVKHVLAFYVEEEVAKTAIALKPGDAVRLLKYERVERKGKQVVYGKEIEIARKEEKAAS